MRGKLDCNIKLSSHWEMLRLMLDRINHSDNPLHATVLADIEHICNVIVMID